MWFGDVWQQAAFDLHRCNNDKYKYLHILQENLKESTRKLDIYEDIYFQQDNEPKHIAGIVKEWILYNTPHILVTLPQSPDVNLIEHLWAIIRKGLQKFNIQSKFERKNTQSVEFYIA